MTLISFFTALSVAGAFFSIPIGVIPISLQNLFALLSGMILGGRLGGYSQLLYLVLGFIGLPVFSGLKGGPAIIFGPTGGFLFGFVFSAYIVGKLTENIKKPTIRHYCFAGLIGLLVIYISGIVQLILVTGLSIKEALAVGIVPFLPGDFLKLIIASFIAVKIKLLVSSLLLM